MNFSLLKSLISNLNNLLFSEICITATPKSIWDVNILRLLLVLNSTIAFQTSPFHDALYLGTACWAKDLGKQSWTNIKPFLFNILRELFISLSTCE